MTDALKRLIADSEQPLSGAGAAIVNGIRNGSLAIRSATVLVPRDALSSSKISFMFETDRGRIEMPYTSRLNEELVRLGVAMSDPDSEAVRIGRLLLDNLRYPDAQFGRHYTDAVLWGVVEERFGRVPAIRAALAEVTQYHPTGDSRFACEAYLRQCIDGVGNEIVLTFRWREPDAFRILAGAVHYMFDQRHHLSARRVLFPRYDSRQVRPADHATEDDQLRGMISGLWLGPHANVPVRPPAFVSAVLPRADTPPTATALTCLDLVRVDTIDPPGRWAWLVLSEAGLYTYSHSSGLTVGETWKFVRWDGDQALVYAVDFDEPLPPEQIVATYGPEAFNRSRQDRNAIQLRLRLMVR